MACLHRTAVHVPLPYASAKRSCLEGRRRFGDIEVCHYLTLLQSVHALRTAFQLSNRTCAITLRFCKAFMRNSTMDLQIVLSSAITLRFCKAFMLIFRWRPLLLPSRAITLRFCKAFMHKCHEHRVQVRRRAITLRFCKAFMRTYILTDFSIGSSAITLRFCKAFMPSFFGNTNCTIIKCHYLTLLQSVHAGIY